MLPEHLVGVALEKLSESQLSTYKVIRAVSEVECYGFFDSVNGYDDGFISLGPCHWTLGIIGKSSIENGELCGYLAYLRYADTEAFNKAIEFFGVRVNRNWVSASGNANGQDLFSKSLRKYSSWVSLQQQDGSYSSLANTENDGDYFRTWHWFYRFVMAGRTIKGFRHRMWDMARIRIRDIRSVPWDTKVGVPDVTDGTGSTRRATIGDVFTSEKAMGLILRWHTRFPSFICKDNITSTYLNNAFKNAIDNNATSLDWTKSPETWGDSHETALINGIMNEVNIIKNKNLTETMTYVRDWPIWASGNNPRGYTLSPAIGNLVTDRNSFTFDDSDLPPAPSYT
jgi:hypothetical protein